MEYISFEFIFFLVSMVLLVSTYFISKRDKNKKKSFIVTTIIVNVIYLLWRILYTLPHNDTISITVGSILLIAECMSFFQATIFKILFWQPYQLLEKTIVDYPNLPSVDIFIATYNEPESVLKKTIAAAINIEYPKNLKTIYLCDDGRRDKLKQLCEQFDIHYVTRSDNKHAKAGNLNNVLQVSHSDLFVILDADMIPKESFLSKTVPYFVEKKVAFVQTPQIFYNPDPFQYNLYFDQSIPNEQDFFMKDIQQGRARFNAVLHVGTNAVFRRSAVIEIGGIPTGTITEDMATGMLLQAKGYEGIFVKEVLALGLSVEKFSDLIKQRERWCRGNIQVAKKWNPLTLKGLSLYQRLIYADGVLFWFFGVQKMIFLLCPLLYLIFGITIIQSNVWELGFLFLPAYVASILNFRTLVKNNRSLTWGHIYDTAMAPYLAIAAVMELCFAKPIPFKVTPKGGQEDKVHISWYVVLPHIILFSFTVLALGLAVHNIATGTENLSAIAINVAWAVYNLLGISMSILVCIERPRFRASERFMLEDEIVIKLSDIHHATCQLENISADGFAMVCKKEEIEVKEVAEELDLVIKGISKKIKGKVMWANEGENKAGIKFSELDVDVYKELIRYLFKSYEGYYNEEQAKKSVLDSTKKVITSIKAK